MKMENLRIARDLLFRTAIISGIFSILMGVSTMAFWDTWSAWTCQWYHVSPDALGPVILNFFAAIKFFFVFVILVPALALHWTIKAAGQGSVS